MTKMMFPKITNFSGAMAAVILFAVCIAAPARAQVAPTVLATQSNGPLTMTLSSSNPSGAADVNNTYTWTVTNTSIFNITGIILGSNWGDYCIGGANGCPVAPPQGPTLISAGPGCAGQSAASFDSTTALFGEWCTPDTGVTLAPGASVSGSVTVRPVTGGPVNYTVYTGHNGPFGFVFDVTINYHGINAPAATDVQISGSASTGSPSVGSNYSYTYQIKNAGPWGTFGGVIFTDVLPASLTYVGSSIVVGTKSSLGPTTITLTNVCSAVVSPVDQTTTVVCPLQDMTVGGVWNQATVTLTVTAPGTAQQIVNTASAHTVSPQDDSNLANNSVTVNVATK